MQIICSLAKLLNKWWHTLPNNSESPHKNRAYHAVGADATVYSMSGLRARYVYSMCTKKNVASEACFLCGDSHFFRQCRKKLLNDLFKIYKSKVHPLFIYCRFYIVLHSPITSRTCVIQIIQCTSISFTFPYQ